MHQPSHTAPTEQPAADAEVLLAGRGICLSRNGRELLREVDIELPAGRIVTLIGPNGSGKTSLVRILLGLERADRGQVRRTRPLRVGYMPQRVHIDPKLPLSVERFLRLSPRRRQGIGAALKEVGIAHLRDSPLQKVSGGEFQRVLLARALLRDPELLVLDEPAQGLDLNGQAEFYELIERIRDRHHCAVLMISHDLHWVMATTDTVVCLNHHVCCHGRPEQVSNDPAYRALFGGRHAELIAPYQHDHDHHHDIHGAVVPEQGEQ